MNVRNALVGTIGAMALSACSIGQSVDKAEAKVDQFHSQLNAASWQAIWDNTAPELRKVTSQKDLTALMDAVHTKLGNVTATKQVGWQTNATTSGSFVTLQMQTTFQRGEASESFVFRNEDEGMKLAGWNIQSNQLIVN